jgi:hypothetical protein
METASLCDMVGGAGICSALPIANWRPSQSGEHCGNSTLLARSDLSCLDHKDVPGDVRYANARKRRDIRAYRFLPWVALKPIVLLWLDVLLLEFLIRPPLFAGVKGSHGLGEELIPGRAQPGDIGLGQLPYLPNCYAIHAFLFMLIGSVLILPLRLRPIRVAVLLALIAMTILHLRYQIFLASLAPMIIAQPIAAAIEQRRIAEWRRELRVARPCGWR